MKAENVAPDNGLKNEYTLTERLIEILKQEQAQLVYANIDGLMAVTKEKTLAVAQISELTNRRYRALTAAGFAPKEDGMRAWLNVSTAPDASKYWHDLLKLAHSAKALNNTNGLLISKHMSRNRAALNALQGTQGGSLYGPNGQSTTKIRARGLVVG